MAKRHWQQCSRDPRAGRWAALYATLNSKGVIHISRNTFELLGEPEAVALLFDKLNSTIGLQPTRSAMKNSHRIVNKNQHHGKIIRAFGFANEFGIGIDDTVRFTNVAIDDDGILVLDLRKTVSAAKERRTPAKD